MFGCAQLVSVMLLFSPVLHGQVPKKLLRLETKFQNQKNAVRKAKILAKLLPREVQMAGEQIQEGEYDQGFARLQYWSNQAQQVHNALVATGRNAVKKPAGFTQLQMALRESIRALRDIIFSLPLGHRHRAKTVEANLRQINSQLLKELFPSPPSPHVKKK